MKIGVISDTHGYLGEDVLKYLESCDEVWHLGDFGNNVSNILKSLHRVRGVYGNIDDLEIRSAYPEHLYFELDGVGFLLIHIGGYPGKYTKKSKELILKYRPNVHLVGHSHICKAVRDEKNDLIHLNPGACGKHGFHAIRTMMTFTLRKGRLNDLKVIELGTR